MKNKSLNFRQLLANLGKMIESGNAHNALPTILKLNEQFPNEPNILHLTAVAQESLKNKSDANEFFIRSLKVKSDQPLVHNNFANFLKEQKRIEQARHHYKQAIHYNTGFAEAWRNLAILEYEENNLNTAYEHATKAASLTPRLSSAFTLLGNICRKNEQLNNAIVFFQRARSKDPKNLKAIYGLAITHADKEEPEKALSLFDEILILAPKMSEALYSKALAELNLGHYKQAIKSLRKLIELNPLHIDAHKTLNEAYWQLGDRKLFCESYRKLSQETIERPEITIAYIENLIAGGLIEDARSYLKSRSDANKSLELIFLQARIEEEGGNLAHALKLYEAAFSRQPDLSITKQYLTALIKNHDFEKVDKLVRQTLQHAPNDQLLWAIQGTCWKMLDDERYHWLSANGNYIRKFVIPTPNGFSNLDEFLLPLKAELMEMHKLKDRPLFQSVRSGIQTPGRLLHKNHPIIHSLKESLREVISDYISKAPKDSKHPFLGRKSIDFKFSGSWSVMLKGGGHHVSHVHPQGWISSAFYVETPPTESTPPKKHAGDIYFGRSPYQLGDKDFIEKQITPTKGSLVLFPSHTWHGTIPLTKEPEYLRMTTPFDVVPSNK
ncbi:tetratricopeptide repeat protein [Microbulbifer epialgicus]|uniref:Tetratricopeptide repeat protein n=1 Tax=Microbulbifer epialgicus TaxID=393907 RepID=A0ABV4P3D8_9GAMM